MLISILCLSLFVSIASSQTETVYNNFGPGNGGWDYVPNFGWSVAGPNCKPPQYGIQQAMGFSPTKTGVVSDIWVAIFYMPSDPQYDEVKIRLARNPDGLPPTADDVMEEWTITEFPPSGEWAEPQHLVATRHSVIEKGKSYWLWAVGGETTWCGWSMNMKWNLTCPHTFRREGEEWVPISNDTASAFRVDVNLDYGLATDTAVLSESVGGTVTFNLCAGKANGGRTYFLCSGMSGTTPGSKLPGGLATLPINWDPLSSVLFTLINTPFFEDFMGKLSMKDGSAQAYLNTFGPMPPGSAGLTLYFAYALNDPWDYASNPVILEIVP
jgi:hypothetical protein